jgi:hypothetical protein
MEQNNGSEDSETPKQRNGSAKLNVPGFIRPLRQTKKMVEKPLMTVNIMEMRRKKGNKKT